MKHLFTRLIMTLLARNNKFHWIKGIRFFTQYLPGWKPVSTLSPHLLRVFVCAYKIEQDVSFHSAAQVIIYLCFIVGRDNQMFRLLTHKWGSIGAEEAGFSEALWTYLSCDNRKQQAAIWINIFCLKDREPKSVSPSGRDSACANLYLSIQKRG